MLLARSEDRLTAAVFGVAAYAVTAAWAPSAWAVTGPQICVYGIGLAWAIRPRMSPAIAMPLLMAAIGLAQIALRSTVSPFTTATAICAWLAYGVVAYLSRECARDKLLAGIAYLAGVLGTLAILVRFTSTFRVFWIFPVKYAEVFGPYVYRNHYAAFVELALGPTLYLALRRREQRPLFILIAAVLIAGVVVAQSRAGLILATAEVLLIAGIGARRGLASKGLAAALALAIIAAVAAVGWSGVAERFEERNAYHVRAEIALSSLDMFRDRPITGWGLGTWRSMYPSYARIDPGVVVNEAHNDWAQWACDGGVLALAAMLAFAGWCAVRGAKTIWGLGVAMVFIHAAVDYPFQEPSIMILTMVLAGLFCAKRERRY